MKNKILTRIAALFAQKSPLADPPSIEYPALATAYAGRQDSPADNARPPVNFVWQTSLEPGQPNSIPGFDRAYNGCLVRIYYPCTDSDCGHIHVAHGEVLSKSADGSVALVGMLTNWDDQHYGTELWGARYPLMAGIEVHRDGHAEQTFVMQSLQIPEIQIRVTGDIGSGITGFEIGSATLTEITPDQKN